MLQEPAYVFAVTGRTWAALREHCPELLPRICVRGAVFARMSSDQKQQLVNELQDLGYYVGECSPAAPDVRGIGDTVWTLCFALPRHVW